MRVQLGTLKLKKKTNGFNGSRIAIHSSFIYLLNVLRRWSRFSQPHLSTSIPTHFNYSDEVNGDNNLKTKQKCHTDAQIN